MRWLYAIAVFMCLTCAFVPAAAYAENAEEEAQMTELTDRYASLNDLTTSRNSDEAVIVDTTVGVLTTVNRALNNMSVRFSGEAVGEVLNGGDGHKWVNVLGANGTSIGVYLSDEQAEIITGLGDYHAYGNTLEVEGTYTIACEEHQGALDVHADSIRVTDRGGEINHIPDRTMLIAALGLCAAGCAFTGLFVLLRRHSTKTKRKGKRKGGSGRKREGRARP